MTQAEPLADKLSAFESHRTHLLAIAYRMTGALSDAEDLLQDVYLKFREVDQAQIRDTKAFLSQMVTRACLDFLKSARVRRERYVGPWLPEPIIDQNAVAVDAMTEYANDISVALLLTLERLSPLERAAFLLHDVFDMEFEEVSAALGRSAAACRQLAARAREHVRAAKPRYRPTQDQVARVMMAFGQAATGGDTGPLVKLLAEDAVFFTDGGGRTLAALKPILGRDRIQRFLDGVARKFPPPKDLTFHVTELNGLPGVAVFHDTEPFATFAFELADGVVTAIYSIRNPEKLNSLRTLVRSASD